MTHQKSIIREAIERLDGLMAIGESRYQAKRSLRASGEHTWAFSTGKIHSYTTRTVYQQQVLAFVNWVRVTHGIKRLEILDERASELATAYLQQHLIEGKSAYTLQTERAALRLFFGDRFLAQGVQIPHRSRMAITRSRGVSKHDRHFQPAHWQTLLAFLRATGLRRHELCHLRVRDLMEAEPGVGGLAVFVANGKGGKSRVVPVLPGREQDIIAMKKGRADEEILFPRIPKHLDIHAYRREYAQALYLHYAPGWALPPVNGRLMRNSYHREAAQRVSWALGHNRIDVVLRHYLR